MLNPEDGMGPTLRVQQRSERVIVVMDVPNIMSSAFGASNGKPGARFSFPNILADIMNFTRSGFSARSLISQTAVMMLSDRVESMRAIQANLERAGFSVDSVTQKNPTSQTQQVSYLTYVGINDGRIRGQEDVDSREFRPKQSEQPMREEGVVDLRVTNTIWERVCQSMKAGTPLDTVVLVSGDGDYADLVQGLKHIGIFVEVYGPKSATSQRLISRADRTVLMSDEVPYEASNVKPFMFYKDHRHLYIRDKPGVRRDDNYPRRLKKSNDTPPTSFTEEKDMDEAYEGLGLYDESGT